MNGAAADGSVSVAHEHESAPNQSTGSVVLTSWYLAVIPNCTNVTKIERNRCTEWIVLVGKRAGMNDLWHSSPITGRLSERQVCTGSGRVYELDGPIDSLSLIDVGFSFGIAEAFRDGFPWNWKDLVISDLCRMKRDLAKETQSQPTSQSSAFHQSSISHDNQTKVQKRKLPQSTTRKVVGRVKSERAEGVGVKKSAARTNDEKMLDDSDSSSDDDIENVTPRGTDAEKSRSGRRIVKPQPHWETRRTRRSMASPLELPKRHWGNHVAFD